MDDALYKQAVKEMKSLAGHVMQDIQEFADEHDYEKLWVVDKFREEFNKIAKKRGVTMNALEKILEEIDSHAIEFESFGMCDDYVSVGWIKEIIRSNMEDFPTENGTLSEYDDKYDVVIHCSSKKDQDETIKIIEDSNWIPVSERLPENDDYILLSFENFSIPDIGRYEQDEEGGAFYPGDEDYTYLSYGLFVNAWKPLPKPYKKERDYE